MRKILLVVLIIVCCAFAANAQRWGKGMTAEHGDTATDMARKYKEGVYAAVNNYDWEMVESYLGDVVKTHTNKEERNIARKFLVEGYEKRKNAEKVLELIKDGVEDDDRWSYYKFGIILKKKVMLTMHLFGLTKQFILTPLF